MKIEFTKIEGLGNDYLFIDAIKQNLKNVDLSDLSKKMSERHFGIGSDGIILLLEAERPGNDYKYRIINSDGSEAEMCGNGIRSFAKFIYDNGISTKKSLRVETLAGIIIPQIIELDEKGKVKTVKVNMGKPVLEGKRIPSTYDSKEVVGEVLYLGNERINFTLVSMGNPHFVVFKEELKDSDVLKLGPQIENDKHFPKRINVEFAKVLNKNEIQMRVWERGVGETMACGTGACATAVAAILNNKVDRKVVVHLIGGDLIIEWTEEGNVFMTGPTNKVFDGVYEYTNS